MASRKIADESSSSESDSSSEEVQVPTTVESPKEPAAKKQESSSEEGSSSEEEAPKKVEEKAAPAKKESSSEEESSEEESSEDEKDKKSTPAQPKKTEEESEEESEEEDSSSEESEEPKKTTQATVAATSTPKQEAPKEAAKKPETEEERKKREKEEKAAEERRIRREELEKAANALLETNIGKELAEKILKQDNLPAIDIVPALISLINDNLNNVAVVTNALGCVRHLEDTTGYKSVFREKDGFSAIIKLLKSEETNCRRVAVRFTGDTITKCGSGENIHNAEAFINAGGAPLIVSLLSDKEPHIQSMSAGTIRVLSGFEGRSTVSFQEEFRTSGAVAPLTNLLALESADMVRQASGAIRGLADGNKVNREEFVNAGVIALLLKQLRGFADSKVQIHLLSALYTLTIQTAKAAEELIKADGLSYMSEEVKLENPEKQELILGILKNTCVDNDEMKSKLRENGLLAIVIELVKAHVPEKEQDSKSTATKPSGQQLTTKERVQKSTCSCLAALTAGNQDNIKVATESEVLDSLLKYLNLESEVVVSRALMAVKSLVTNNAANLEVLAKKQVIGRIVALLRSKSYDVRDTAVGVLLQCVTHEKLKKEMARSAVDVLIEIMYGAPIPDGLAILNILLEDSTARANFANDKYNLMKVTSFLDDAGERVIINTCSILSLVSQNNTKGQNRIVKYSGAVRLVRLLESSNANILHHVAYAIWSVAKKNTKAQTAFGKAKALNSVINVLKSDKCTDILREYGLGALYSILLDNWSNKKEFGKLNGVVTVVPLLRNDSVKVRINAAKAIWAATEGTSLLFGTLEDSQNQAHSGIESLIKMMKTDKLPQQSSAASAIYAICNKNVRNQKAAVGFGAIDLLVKMVNDNSKFVEQEAPKAEATRWAVVAIGVLVKKNPDGQNAAKKAGAVAAIEPLKSTAHKNIQKEAIATLNELGAKAKPAKEPKPAKKEEPKKEAKKEEDKKEEKKEEPKKETKKEESESDDESEDEESDEKKPAQNSNAQPAKKASESEESSEEESDEEPKKQAVPAKKEESDSESEASSSVSQDDKKEPPAKQAAPAKKEESSSEESSEESE